MYTHNTYIYIYIHNIYIYIYIYIYVYTNLLGGLVLLRRDAEALEALRVELVRELMAYW